MNKTVLFLVCIFTLVLSSCDNELELAADYEEKMVVYGLLDHTKDTQFVKINKTFLGSGSALDYAQEPDSFIYEDIRATLTNLSNNQLILLEEFQAPKKEGIFSSKKNIVYITDQPIVGGQKYRLDVLNNKSGESVNATTSVINDVSLLEPVTHVALRTFGNTFSTQRIAFSVPNNVFRYEAKMLFNYIEYPKANPTDTIRKTIEFSLGVRLRTEAENGRVVYLFDGERFYNKVKEVVSVDASLEREIAEFDFIVHVAPEELQLFIEANGPLDGISQVRPEYTNVENGYGVFSSSFSKRERRLLDKSNSANYMKTGEFEKYNFVDNM